MKWSAVVFASCCRSEHNARGRLLIPHLIDLVFMANSPLTSFKRTPKSWAPVFQPLRTYLRC